MKINMVHNVLYHLSDKYLKHGGFYRTSDQQWVKLERLQFVGACNPPTVREMIEDYFEDY